VYKNISLFNAKWLVRECYMHLTIEMYISTCFANLTHDIDIVKI